MIQGGGTIQSQDHGQRIRRKKWASFVITKTLKKTRKRFCYNRDLEMLRCGRGLEVRILERVHREEELKINVKDAMERSWPYSSERG
jgi:hypothetical protein